MIFFRAHLGVSYTFEDIKMPVSLRMLALVGLTLTPVAGWADDYARSISVSGTGEITLPADQATIRVGVQSGGGTSAEAMNGASNATAAILALLADEGIAPTDVQTQGLRLTPVYKRGLSGVDYTQISGYSAVNTVSVTTTDLNSVGQLLADIVELGGNRIDGVTFGLSDPDAHQDEARILAVQDARAKAELYAEAAGIAVGQVISITENGFSGRAVFEMAHQMTMADSSVADVPLAPGEITVSASVSLMYEIAD